MIAAYLRERFRLAVFVPVSVAIAASAGGPGLGSLAVDAACALLLLAEFRLRDDLGRARLGCRA